MSAVEVPIAQKIARMQRIMEEMPQVEMPPVHTFGPGFYARTITIPANTTLVGKEHATDHIFIVSRGDITLVTDDGEVRVQAPFQVVCKAGRKRAGYTHTETVCTNVHIVSETDVLMLEAALIQPDSAKVLK